MSAAALSFGDFLYAKVEDAVGTGRYAFKIDDEYKVYAKTLQDNNMLTFKMKSTQRFVGLEPLINARFSTVAKTKSGLANIGTSSRR